MITQNHTELNCAGDAIFDEFAPNKLDMHAHVKVVNDYSIQQISMSLPSELYSSQLCRRADEIYIQDNLGNSILVLQLLLSDICKIFSRFGYIVS